MTRIARIAAAAAIPLAALATAAQAQLAGIPVYFNPAGGTGLGLAANVGFPNSDAGSGTAYGVAGSIGTGPVTISAMVGAWKATGGSYGWTSAQTSFGGSLSYRLFGGGMLPVAVAAQVGYGMIKTPDLPIVGSQTTTYIYASDIWNSGNLSLSTYLWLPFTWDGTKWTLTDSAQWSINLATGVVTTN